MSEEMKKFKALFAQKDFQSFITEAWEVGSKNHARLIKWRRAEASYLAGEKWFQMWRRFNKKKAYYKSERKDRLEALAMKKRLAGVAFRKLLARYEGR